MRKYLIEGGRKLSGSVEVQSAKNAVLPILAGAILTNEKVVIKNCPKIGDVLSMLKILYELGANYIFYGDDLELDCSSVNSYVISSSSAKELRSSIFLLGALISRFKKAQIPYPGGCEIGLRPIDVHIKALKEIGVKITETEEGVLCDCDKIKANTIKLRIRSVGATENIILASIFCDGTVVIKNPAKEPEIVDLANFLNKMGAQITGVGSDEIRIIGVKKLHGIEYKPIPDRIEAGTFLIGAMITGGELEIRGVEYKNISLLLNKICNNTCAISINNDIIYLKSGGVKNSFDIVTGPYPEFPTDLQSQMLTYATICNGISTIKEVVFENRFRNVSDLIKMGAKISVNGDFAVVEGGVLEGKRVHALDLRGGASLVLAGLVAHGQTIVDGINHIERGYCDFDLKLLKIGADIKKID